jgi:hypothetical protein
MNSRHHVEVPTSVAQLASRAVLGGRALLTEYRRAAAMTVLVEPFASVYDDRSCIGVLARGGRGFEVYAADDHSLGLFPSPRKAAAAITTTRPWLTQTTAQDKAAQPEGT